MSWGSLDERLLQRMEFQLVQAPHVELRGPFFTLPVVGLPSGPHTTATRNKWGRSMEATPSKQHTGKWLLLKELISSDPIVPIRKSTTKLDVNPMAKQVNTL